jgi:two-component system, LytTR family, sensor histidine kinase AlgZ
MEVTMNLIKLVTPRRNVKGIVIAWIVVIATLLAVISWFQFLGGRPLPAIVRNDLPWGVLLASTITILCSIVMPRLAARLGRRRGLAFWGVLLPSMAVCGVAGTAAAAVFAYLIRLVPAHAIAGLFMENVSGTVPVTMIIGVVVTLLGSANARVQATELSLQTQRLERERAEKLAAEAQLASLSSRVQPHFLFNTLNSISGLIREHPSEAETMIEHLSSLLRSSLDSKDAIPVAEELRLVTDYLEIQRTRLGSRLRYDLAVETRVAGDIPPFSVQTLVENAVKHVAARRTEGVTVRVSVRRDGSSLLIGVTDDGPGFDPDAMTAGHGLDVLQRRLRAIFGARASLDFHREPHAMTVQLRVPAA